MIGATSSPPPERGRTASEASQVGVRFSLKFNRTRAKTARARTLRQASTDVAECL